MATTFNPKGIRGKATTLARDASGVIRCTLYGTVVFTLTPEGVCTVSTGGYNTPTTHRRMNDCMQHMGQAYPTRNGHPTRFGTADFRTVDSLTFQGVPFNGKLPRCV